MQETVFPLPTTQMGFPGDSVGKNPPANAGDSGSIPGLGRSPGKFHGQRSLAGYSPWGRKRAVNCLATKQ